MKIHCDNFGKTVDEATKKVIERLLNMMQNDRSMLIAKFEYIEPTDENISLISKNEREIVLGYDFNALSSLEKLMVLKATINTHMQVTDGYIIGFGIITAYELIFNKSRRQKKVLFSTTGELIQGNI